MREDISIQAGGVLHLSVCKDVVVFTVLRETRRSATCSLVTVKVIAAFTTKEKAKTYVKVQTSKPTNKSFYHIQKVRIT